MNKLGNKHIHQYFLEEVWAPGDAEPREVLRRLEAKKETPNVTEPGQIVVSNEERFNAINKWHQQSGHFGQERTGNTAAPSIGMLLRTMSSTIA